MNVFPGFTAPPSPRDLRTGEIIGWRCWWVDAAALRLRSLFAPSNPIWLPGVPMLGDPDARMPRDSDRKIGIYAVKANDEWLRAVIRDSISYAESVRCRHDALAVGTVRLYGRVDEHEHGYRAEAAMVETIERLEAVAWSTLLYSNNWLLLPALRAAYFPEGDVTALPGIDSAQWTGR